MFEQRKWLRVFRGCLILNWINAPLVAALSYIIPWTHWDSHLAGIIGLAVVLGSIFLVMFGVPSWRQQHIETWRLLRKKLPLDTINNE